jgi:hypothetical protein
MIEIGQTIVSFDIIEEYFLCDLPHCRGACCIEGDSGAPLEKDEALAIERDYCYFAEVLPENQQKEISRQGYSVIDSDGDLVTPLIENRQCAYSFHDENNILKCAIEKAWSEEKISFRKPISCHLFPIRITAYKRFDAVNYQQLDICKAGRLCGRTQKLPLYKFLKEPLIRKYGKEWYLQLEEAAKLLAEKP